MEIFILVSPSFGTLRNGIRVICPITSRDFTIRLLEMAFQGGSDRCVRQDFVLFFSNASDTTFDKATDITFDNLQLSKRIPLRLPTDGGAGCHSLS